MPILSTSSQLSMIDSLASSCPRALQKQAEVMPAPDKPHQPLSHPPHISSTLLQSTPLTWRTNFQRSTSARRAPEHEVWVGCRQSLSSRHPQAPRDFHQNALTQTPYLHKLPAVPLTAPQDSTCMRASMFAAWGSQCT